ncbi:MAG TPA: hypothetical protein VFZ34_30285 [Blastocatellia bacterium]|nr:hypothetical protein [Blastocatellia bacterium]
MKNNTQRNTIKAASLSALLLVSFALALFAQPQIPQPGVKPPTLELRPIGFSNVVTKTKDFQMQVTGTKFTDTDLGRSATGTGTLKLTGTLTNVNGCCARIKMEIVRFRPGNAETFAEQTFEFCGSQNVNISKSLNANQDDARFIVKMTNPDPWNKITVNGNFTLSVPTADVILTAQPNIPIDLTRGVDVARTFKLNPNTPGKLKVEIRWSGAASLQAKLFKPGQQVGATGSSVLTRTGSGGALDLDYDITPADITSGNQWAVNVLNNSSSSVTATGITFRVIYTIEE